MFVLLGDGVYVVGGDSPVVDGDEGSSCAGVLVVERVVGAGALGPELAEA